MHSHERVGLLLLLENGSRSLVNLWRISKGDLSEAFGDAYILVLGARTISAFLLAASSYCEAGGDPRTLVPWASHGLVQPTYC